MIVKHKWMKKAVALVLALGILSGNVFAWEGNFESTVQSEQHYTALPNHEELAVENGQAKENTSGGISDSESVVIPTFVPNKNEELTPETSPELSPAATISPMPETTAIPEKTAAPQPTQTPIPEATATPVPTPTMTPVPTATSEPMESAAPKWMDSGKVRDRINEIVEKTVDIGWMNEEELRQFSQEIKQFQEEMEQELDDLQRVDLADDLVRLENAAVSVKELCNIWDALHNGTLSELEQNEKENSWRYQNGTLVEPGDAVPYADLELQSEHGAYRGIDVSRHQGTIDWNAVKASGIDFAIIRCGYGSDYSDQDDSQWRTNVEACERLGIPYGVYLYSYATSLDQARSEAAHALRLLNGCSPSLPVFIDLEEPRTQVLGGEMITQIANTFCSILEQNGYKTGVYASLSWWEYYFQDWFTSNPNYYHWIAHWSNSCGYNGRYEAWQYTNRGSVNGISGPVDLNYWYGPSLDVYDNRYDEARYAAVYDYNYYVSHNSDLVGLDRVQAIRHFVNYGMAEGRSASASFSPFVYRAKYADLYNAYENNLVKYYEHYINYGKNEGRTAEVGESYRPLTVYQGVDYSVVYNYNYYIANNSDVAALTAGNDYLALQQFVNYGMEEGRKGNEEFNVQVYANKYVDVYNAFGYNWYMCYMHYLTNGYSEGRSAKTSDSIYYYQGVDYSVVYDYDYYIAHNPDIAKAMNGNKYLTLQHFVNWGMKEGRQASDEFNVAIYCGNYPDLQEALGQDTKAYYMHYVYTGKAEGRVANRVVERPGITVYNGHDYSAVYNYKFYIKNNPDVYNYYNGDQAAILAHFVNQGMKEGRQGSRDFNVTIYRSNYADLRAAFGEDTKAYYMHYVYTGNAEGRIANKAL